MLVLFSYTSSSFLSYFGGRRPFSPPETCLVALEAFQERHTDSEIIQWEGVVEDVASNRSAGVYKRVVRGVLQKRIDELIEGVEGVKGGR